MNFISAILLGLLQGLTEFIPVSSSGHLVLIQHFFKLGENQNITFEVFLHLGTLFAVLAYFRNTILDLLVSLFNWKNTVSREIHRKNRNLIAYLIVSTFLTGFVYLIFGDTFKRIYDMPGLVAGLLLATGAMVFLSDFFRDAGIPASNMGNLRAMLIGLGQGIAILPGISRSGTTLTFSLATGIKRQDAAHYSFLLSIPAILAANLSEFKVLASLDTRMIFIYLAGFVASFVSGYLVIAFLIRLIVGSRIKVFAIYCWVAGLISLLLIYLGL